MSGREVVSASTAMISDETVMSKPVDLSPPLTSTKGEESTSAMQPT